jgi:hypothetical protein
MMRYMMRNNKLRTTKWMTRKQHFRINQHINKQFSLATNKKFHIIADVVITTIYIVYTKKCFLTSMHSYESLEKILKKKKL